MNNNELIEKAIAIAKEKDGKVTVNTLKIRLHIGTVTANELIDKLTELGLLN